MLTVDLTILFGHHIMLYFKLAFKFVHFAILYHVLNEDNCWSTYVGWNQVDGVPQAY